MPSVSRSSPKIAGLKLNFWKSNLMDIPLWMSNFENYLRLVINNLSVRHKNLWQWNYYKEKSSTSILAKYKILGKLRKRIFLIAIRKMTIAKIFKKYFKLFTLFSNNSSKKLKIWTSKFFSSYKMGENTFQFSKIEFSRKCSKLFNLS